MRPVKEEVDTPPENVQDQGSILNNVDGDDSLETILCSSLDTTASGDGVTMEKVWAVKPGEHIGVDRPVLFQPSASPPVSSSTPKGQDNHEHEAPQRYES